MKLQAECSLYPLRTTAIGAPLRDFLATLENAGLQVEQGPMSSLISGDADALFSGLSQSYQHIAQHHQSVLLVKISNACPSGSAQRQDSRNNEKVT